MGTLWQDTHCSIRTLARNRGFTATAVGTLALGIGASTAIFTLINAMFLERLPVRDPQRLVLVATEGDVPLRYPHYEQLCRESHSFSGLFAFEPVCTHRLHVAGSDNPPEPIQAQAVSVDFFDVMGVRPAFGRSLTLSDDRPYDAQPVVVISHGFWRRCFGLDPTVIGHRVTLDDVPFTIVGVAPRGFFGIEVGKNPDLWWPISMVPSVDRRRNALTSQGGTWVYVMGRLKPAVTREQASAELSVVYHQIVDQESVRWRLSEEQRRGRVERRIKLKPGGAGWTTLRDDFRRPLFTLMAIVGLVLLVACANLAGLLMTRGAARQRELCVRSALGASRLTLARQLATESLLLAGMGGLLGLLLAQWGACLLARYVPGHGETILLKLTPDARVLAFTLAVSIISGVLFGIVPAWRGSRVGLATALQDRTGNLMGSRQVWNKGFVVSQISLSFCLLIGAGLLVRTVQKLSALDLGFNREHLMVFGLDIEKDYEQTRWVSLCHDMLERVRTLPGVRCVSLSSVRSLTGADGGLGPQKVAVPGVNPASEESLKVSNIGVAPQYFETMGIRLLRGRDFGPQDNPAVGVDPGKQTTHPVILDQTGARKLFGDQNPVGKHLQPIGLPPGLVLSSLEVIGMVADTIHKDVRDGSSITLYSLETFYNRGFVFFYVRTLGNPLASADGIRQVVRELDPRVEVTGLRTMNDLLNEQLLRERLTSQLAGFFGLSTLLLACLGLYGILSYGVVRRTQEIGVRMALGARAGDVLSLVIRQGMMLGLVGCVIGILLAIALTRLISTQLYGVRPTDPLTFIGVGLILLVVVLLACYLPARRAAQIDPMAALRCE